MNEILNFIDGSWSAPVSKSYLDLVDPATGEISGKVSDSSGDDVARAVAVAERAFPEWSAKSSEERSRILRKIAEGIERNLEAFAQAETLDTGKPITLSRSLDIPRAAQNFSFFADAITQFSSDAHGMGERAINYTLREPLGVVACISPWNLPLYLLSWKIAPALASGCTVVAKPSEFTPRTADLLSRICGEAGLPPGVLNFIHGNGARAGAALVSHPEIKAISFTGSTKTGAEIARVAGPAFKKLSLEMGGKNAALVFADCDFEATVKSVALAAFLNQGQICLCGSRILVEKKIYEQFKAALVTQVKTFRQGDPLLPETDQGAIVSRAQFEKVMGHIETAKREGGKILTGGKRAEVKGRCSRGWFIEPTLIEGLPSGCQTNQEEIFGPVATLIPFESDTEALEIANSTSYGLSATVWTQDVSRAHRAASRLHAGVIWVNCWLLRDLRTPFGGMKNSGVGREGGQEALAFFTEQKNVCIKFNEN